MKKLFLLIAVFYCAISQAQVTWEKKLNIYHNGELAPGEPSAVIETPDKGFIITGAGRLKSTNSFIGYIYKLDSNGDSVWCKTYAGTAFGRIANVFYNNNNELMIAMEYLISGKKQNIIFAKVNESNGDTSNSFIAAKPNNLDGYQYTKHIEMSDGSYIVLVRDVSSFSPGASHLFRFMPGSDAHIWNAEGLAKRVWGFYDMILDGDGVVLAGNANTGTFQASYIVVRYDLDGDTQWSALYPVPGDYLTSQSYDVVAGSTNYISVGDRVVKINNILQRTPAVAIISKTGDTLSYNTLITPVPGTIRQIIKSGNKYYGIGHILSDAKDPNNNGTTLYKMAVFEINENGSFSVVDDFDFGVLALPNGNYLGSQLDGFSLITASDNDVVLLGSGHYQRSDSTDYKSAYIVKMKPGAGTNAVNPAITENLNIYPNPSSGYLTIINNGKEGSLKITSLLGQEVFNQPIEGNAETTVISLNHLPAGTYVVVFECAEGILTERLVIVE